MTKKKNRGWRKSAGKFKLYDVQAINFGWFRRKHGILLENLPNKKQKLLKENNFMKFLDADPRTFEIIFMVEDMNDWAKVREKDYWNPYTDHFSTLRELELDAGLIDWNCAICKTEIKCRIDSPKKVENFVCIKCGESHNSKNKVVDKRIIDSSTNLTKHVKTLLTKEQKEFIQYSKKSSKV
jgi:Zn ribbon nucleic-acid-binding protein